MSDSRSYEDLDRKTFEELCSQRGLSFKKKVPKRELKNLLMASDQEADAPKMLAVRNQLQLEHEQKWIDLRLHEKQKIVVDMEREARERIAKMEQEAAERERAAHLRHMERLAAEEKAHQMQQKSARLQLQVLEDQKRLR
ncbi:hypothetical protein UY3_04182 [Chelonia mydas]|uniref:Uncharacterized protein n=1 Tax=Chelonia mydas TaxID=8469 RepID=M7BL37_CHEMY|nr:hypothetical protein UY3_04182 [Chelonia mydas]